MALLEKEFVVKNGIDIKNSVIKLNGVQGTLNQLVGWNTAGTALEWKTLTTGSGITAALGAGSITLDASGLFPAGATVETTFRNGQNLLVGARTGAGTFRNVTASNAVEIVPGAGTSLTNLILASNNNDGSSPVFVVTTAGNTTIGGTLAVTGAINKVTLTPPATAATLTILNNKTFTVNNTITFSGTDGTVITLPSTTSTIPTTTHTFFIGTRQISISQATGTVTLPNDAIANPNITIGTTAVNLGAASTSFTGLTALSSAAATDLSVTTGTTGALTIDTGTTGAINFGTNANAKAITLGNATVATSFILNGTGGVRISNTAAETTSVYASMTGALRVAGGFGATGNSYIGGSLAFNGSILSTNNTANTQLTDQLTTFTSASISVTTSWIDSGISGVNLLKDGLYQFKIRLAASNDYWIGTLPWYGANGAASLGDTQSEIVLTRYGDGNNVALLFARILRTASGAPKVQLSANSTITSSTYTFTFRKLMD